MHSAIWENPAILYTPCILLKYVVFNGKGQQIVNNKLMCCIEIYSQKSMLELHWKNQSLLPFVRVYIFIKSINLLLIDENRFLVQFSFFFFLT